ncbi:MAG: hypothetical protein ACRYFU_24240, partial [Janthinobacterium lividum]
QHLPLTRGGTFSRMLGDCLAAAQGLFLHLRNSPLYFVPQVAPQLDIVVWAMAGESAEESSRRAQKVFDEAARLDLHLALARLPVTLFAPNTWPRAAQDENVFCLRSVLMKPEHLPWLGEVCSRLDQAAAKVVER